VATPSLPYMFGQRGRSREPLPHSSFVLELQVKLPLPPPTTRLHRMKEQVPRCARLEIIQPFTDVSRSANLASIALPAALLAILVAKRLVKPFQ